MIYNTSSLNQALSGCGAATMRQTYGFSHRAGDEVNSSIGLLFSLMQYITFHHLHIYRGVAQLVARAVWDREVEGSSPFTPTIEK